MARFGSLPVIVPEGVEVILTADNLMVKGPRGELKKPFPRMLKLEIKDGQIFINRQNDAKQTKALQGSFKSHLTNMITGVTAGFKKELELVGAGYRAELKEKDLSIMIGFSHPVEVVAPEGVVFTVTKNIIGVEGIDKEVVGQVAAKIRDIRKPEPYKGKGIKYIDEVVRRKPGKQAAKTE